jgi:hypothetical protein
VKEHLPTDHKYQLNDLYNNVDKARTANFERSTQALGYFALEKVGSTKPEFKSEYNKFSKIYNDPFVTNPIRPINDKNITAEL